MPLAETDSTSTAFTDGSATASSVPSGLKANDCAEGLVPAMVTGEPATGVSEPPADTENIETVPL